METYISIRIVALVFLISLFLYTVYLIRANKLNAHLAISWIITELLLMASVIIEKIPATIKLIVGERKRLEFWKFDLSVLGELTI